jgi:hypothetical protein
LTVDPVFNDPAPTVVDGVSYTIREIKYRDARRMGLTLVTVLVDAAKGKTPAEVIAGQLDTVEELVRLSAGVEPGSFEDLPVSHFVRLVGKVLERHQNFLEELFQVRHQLLGLVPRSKNGGTPASAPPSSSSP